MKFFFSIGIVLFFFVSCKNSQDEVVKFEELVKPSNYHENNIDTNFNYNPYIPPIDLSLLAENHIKWDTIFQHEQLLLPDRFSPTKTIKFTYITNDQSIDYYQWNFKDSTKSMLAFLNWMNCFGDRCKIVELNSEINLQRNATLILQNDSTIIYIHNLPNNKEIEKWKNMYLKIEDIKWNYIINQPKNSVAKWSKFINEL